jgi:hypothetical protein
MKRDLNLILSWHTLGPIQKFILGWAWALALGNHDICRKAVDCERKNLKERDNHET